MDSRQWFLSVTSILTESFAATKLCCKWRTWWSHHRGLAELFRELAERLRGFAAFELATFSPRFLQKRDAGACIGGS